MKRGLVAARAAAGPPALSGFYFVNKVLIEADFTGLTLSGANFTAADLTNVQLDDATLDDAEFLFAKLENVFLESARLSGEGPRPPAVEAPQNRSKSPASTRSRRPVR